VIKHDYHICFIKKEELDIIAFSNVGPFNSEDPRSQRRIQHLIEKQQGKKCSMQLINTK